MLQAGHTPLGLCSSTSCLLGSVEEELSVLPRHTKVVVTGNNRTKSVLVGLRGVVKKAVGLGGWHWLVLTNGVEVKLQRNALSVIEAPTGQEEDDDSDTLLSSETSIDDFSRTTRPRVRLPKIHSAMPKLSACTEPANLKASLEKRRGTSAELKPNNHMRVDLSKLETAALRRYQRRFNLVEVGPNPSKEKLVDAVRRHFMSLQLDELQVIAEFVQAVKRLKT